MRLEPFEPNPIQLMRVAAAAGNTNTIQQCVVPIPDPRLSVSISIVFQRDDGTQTAVPPGDRKAWICARCKSTILGKSFPVTNILGNGNNSNTDMGDLIPASAQITASLQGYSREWASGADEIFVDVRVGNAGGSAQTGTWWLVVKYKPADTMCPEEWSDLQKWCVPNQITLPGTSNN